MKLARFILSFLILANTQVVLAEVKIEFVGSVDMLAVNESKPEIKSGGFFSGIKSITLPNGVNQIVFRYNAFFDIAGEVQSVSSEVIIARFEAYDTELKFKFPEFTDAEMAKEEMNPLSWSLMDVDGKQIKHSGDTLEKMGLQLGRDFVAETRQYNEKKGIAAIKLSDPKTSVQASMKKPQSEVLANVKQMVNESSAPSAPKSTAEEMLYFWYEKADEDTKARFKAFINQQ